MNLDRKKSNLENRDDIKTNLKSKLKLKFEWPQQEGVWDKSSVVTTSPKIVHFWEHIWSLLKYYESNDYKNCWGSVLGPNWPPLNRACHKKNRREYMLKKATSSRRKSGKMRHFWAHLGSCVCVCVFPVCVFPVCVSCYYWKCSNHLQQRDLRTKKNPPRNGWK